MQKYINIEEYFLVCREIDECVKSKKEFINIPKDVFKSFVDYCYKNTLFKFMSNCMCDVMELYIYLSSIKPMSFLMNDDVFINKMDCVLEIMNLYDENSFESFFEILKSESFKKIILFQVGNILKINKIKKLISEFTKYKTDYNVYQFSDLIFNGFIASEHKYLTFMEILKQDKLNLKSFEALVDLESRDFEDLILFKIANKAGLNFDLQTARVLYRNLKILGSSKKNACEVYAQRNDIVLNDKVFEDKDLLDDVFNTFFKNYIIVDVFGKVWGSKMG